MIFAAGLGTRLRPLTDRTPKALVEIGGITLLERTIERLASAGCDRIVVNLYHHAAAIEDFLRSACQVEGEATGGVEPAYWWHGAGIFLSMEAEAPLETGGGIKQAGSFFRGDRTILVHNVDVISRIDLTCLARAHEATGALATLAVNRRSASRYLVFDESGLCGRVDSRNGSEEWARSPSEPHWQGGFAGIHALSPHILGRLTEQGTFSIMRSYLRLAAEGARILPLDVTGAFWMDVGTPERLDAARRTWDRPH